MARPKFIRVISGILICALSALFYVHQQVEIVRTSFLVNKHRRQVSFLLDQYRSLVYNLSRLESPKRIEDRLSANEVVLCMPKSENKRHIGRVELAHEREKPEEMPLLARILDRFSTRAEAKVVK